MERKRGASSVWKVSIVTVGELVAGLHRAGHLRERSRRTQRLTQVLTATDVLYVDVAVTNRYGELRAATGRKPSNDLWIAATALAHDLTLVTADRSLAALPGVRTRLVGAA